MFSGLVVLIVNGGCNTGRTMALEYAKQGAKVVVHGPKLVVDVTVEEIRSLGDEGVAVDKDPFEAAYAEYNHLDVVVIVTMPGEKDEPFDDRMQRMTKQTYKTAMDAHIRLSKQGSGSMLVILNPGIEGVGYKTERKILMGMCKSFAAQNENIKCNCIVPVEKKAELNTALVALALTSPFWAYSGNIFEVTSKAAQQLLHMEELAYTYSLDLLGADKMLKYCLPIPVLSVMKDKVAIVTGAGGGLGLTVARRLVALGVRVVAYESNMMTCDGPELKARESSLKRRRRSLAEVIRSKPEPKGKAKEEVYVYINSMSEEETVRLCVEKFGRVDILINCASVPTFSLRQDISPFYWEMMIRHHIKASHCMSQHVWPLMAKQREGHIVNIATMDKVRASALALGMAGLSQALAEKGAKDNIHVNCIMSSAASGNPTHAAESLCVLLASCACPFQGTTLGVYQNQVTIIDMTSKRANSDHVNKEAK